LGNKMAGQANEPARRVAPLCRSPVHRIESNADDQETGKRKRGFMENSEIEKYWRSSEDK
jgi:hypothetical protein